MPLTQLATTVILSLVFGGLSLVHVFWALGPTTADLTGFVPTNPDTGRPQFVPGTLVTLAVAAALALVVPIIVAKVNVAIWVVAVVFGLRAVGDFKQIGVFKRIKTTKFAKNDTRFFTPLCVAVALMLVSLVA